MLPTWSSHYILHTFSFETQLQYFVLDSLVAEVWIKGCNIKLLVVEVSLDY
jgi:hypothetical protein